MIGPSANIDSRKSCCSCQVHRNLDPALHPHEKAIEYTRALNAAKLQRVFAKPFVGALPHDDGVTALARNPAQLNSLVSGTADGTVRLWDVAAQRCLRRLEGRRIKHFAKLHPELRDRADSDLQRSYSRLGACGDVYCHSSSIL